MGDRARAFVVLVIILFFQLIVGTTVNRIVPSSPFSFIVASVVTAFVQPLMPIATTFLYYSMKAKEALPDSKTVLGGDADRSLCYFPYCGKHVTLDANFCKSCGERIQDIVKA